MEGLKTQNILRNLSSERLETERLTLLPVSMEYAPMLLAELTDEITRYLSFFTPQSIDEEVSFINQSREKMRMGTDFALVILDNKSKEFLGIVGLHNLATRSPEFGIWVKKSAHGKKIGREAVAGVYMWAVNNPEFDYFIYPAHKDNIPSRKIAESLGGVVVSSGKKVFPTGKEFDEVVYYIPRERSPK